MDPRMDRIPARARPASRPSACSMRPQTRQRHRRSRRSLRIFCLSISCPSRRPRHLSNPNPLSWKKTTVAHRHHCFAWNPPASWRACRALAPEEAALNRAAARQATAANSMSMANRLAAVEGESAALAWALMAMWTGPAVGPKRTAAARQAQIEPSQRPSTASNSCI